jgi:hypothetical protein
VPSPTDLPSKLTPVANSSPISTLSKHQHHDVLRIAFQPSLCHSWCAEQCIITWPGRKCQNAFRCCCDFTDLPVRIGTRRIWCYGFVEMRAHIITIRPIRECKPPASTIRLICVECRLLIVTMATESLTFEGSLKNSSMPSIQRDGWGWRQWHRLSVILALTTSSGASTAKIRNNILTVDGGNHVCHCEVRVQLQDLNGGWRMARSWVKISAWLDTITVCSGWWCEIRQQIWV